MTSSNLFDKVETSEKDCSWRLERPAKLIVSIFFQQSLAVISFRYRIPFWISIKYKGRSGL